VQPWYFSETANQWYKLTFSGYPLDTAIGTGHGSTHWSGTTIVDLYTLTPSSSTIDYSNYIVTSADTTKTIGYGKIVATSEFIIAGRDISIENTFFLGQQDKFVKIITRIINTSPTILENSIVWTGTRDDFVGTTDVNTKTRGNLDTGSFVAVTSNSQSSRAIMITNTNEGVLFYSETAGVMTSYALCCSFSNAYNTNPLSLAPRTLTPTDGSYAAVLPFGDIAPGSSGSIIWYYAAGTVASLSDVAQSVAVDQVANGPNVTVASISSSGSASESQSPLYSYTPFASESSRVSYSPFASQSSRGSYSPFASQSSRGSYSPFVTESSRVSYSPFASESSRVSYSPFVTESLQASYSPFVTDSSRSSYSPFATESLQASYSPFATDSSLATKTSSASHTSQGSYSPFATETSMPSMSHSSTSTAVSTISSINTESSSPTPSTTPSFNIRYIIVQAPIPNISVSESYITNINHGESSINYGIVYLAIFAPLNIILLCVCCFGLCVGLRFLEQKRKNNFTLKVSGSNKKKDDNLFNETEVKVIDEKDEPNYNKLNLNEPTS
jgi:hypothetical protein